MTTIAQAAADRYTAPYMIAAWLDLGSDYHDTDVLSREQEEDLADYWPAW